MMAYAAYTTTKRNLAGLRAAGWGMMLSPATGLNAQGLRYALDNGKWSEHTGHYQWSKDAFIDALERCGPGADFVVAPDIVEGGMASLELSRTWLSRCLKDCPRALIAVQDGMELRDVWRHLEPRVGVFIGGSTAWKERTMRLWARAAHDAGTICHAGRVNTQRRIALCQAANVDSFDGSSATRYAVNLPGLDGARRQPDLLRGLA